MPALALAGDCFAFLLITNHATLARADTALLKWTVNELAAMCGTAERT